MRGRVGVVDDDLGVLGRLVHRGHRDPAGPEQPDPDAAVAPPVVPEGEAHVPRVLQVQGHPDRHVPVQQGARLDQQALAGLQVADERVARSVQEQQSRALVRAEDVTELAHRVVNLAVVAVLPGLVPDVRGIPVVLDAAGGGEETVLPDPDLLAVLHRQGHDLAGVVVGQREVPGAAALDHDQRHAGHLAVAGAAHRHVGQPGLRLGPQQHVVGEVDPVVRREVELGDRDGGARDLEVGLAELQPRHVLVGRLLDPPGVADRGPDVNRRPAQRAGGRVRVARLPAVPANVRVHPGLQSAWWWTYIDWMPTRPGPVISARYMPCRISPVFSGICAACICTEESLYKNPPGSTRIFSFGCRVRSSTLPLPCSSSMPGAPAVTNRSMYMPLPPCSRLTRPLIRIKEYWTLCEATRKACSRTSSSMPGCSGSTTSSPGASRENAMRPGTLATAPTCGK